MGKAMTKVLCSLAVLVLSWVVPSVSMGVTVDCGSGDTIQAAVNGATLGTTITVKGICNENVIIPEGKDRISLVGMPGAEIRGTQPGHTVVVLGRWIIIRGFTITGGTDGVEVLRGGTAMIDSSTIQNVGRHGIVFIQNAFGFVINSTIQNNSGYGILVDLSSSSRIGFLSTVDPASMPNTIQHNAGGVVVASSSSAQIIGNTISNNTGDGILVAKVSQADISDNTINGNGRNGILVTQNSGVNLGKDTGDTMFDLPNKTTVNNGDKGLRCSTGGYADGRLGTLNGTGNKGATSFTKDCIDSLIY